ncbi:Clavaminate synthase [Fusarium tjaetaba]|uniref:Clavaminate synthase n=1 Tax=Fusarium tjaetaba TaxID=1567544 RepID=A0A8H5RRU1_9HYPO|nr:Clavaminate synthase [Fusarium tjaetaba]KAF5637297.1 Clavaminate synthase [Fusarium tjaetaba]
MSTTATITKTTRVLSPESADFTTISYTRIKQGNANELAALLRACEKDGFLYLDLRNTDAEAIPVIKEVPLLYKGVNNFFQLDEDEKMKYDVDTIGPWKLNGYTPFGRNAGLAGDGKKHGVEGYTFPRDGICNPVVDDHPLSLPQILQDEAPLLASVMDKLHEIGLGLLDALDQISHEAGTPLAPKHLPTDPSTSCMTVQRYPSLSIEGPNAGLSAHTDVGSLTILFCGDRGLQTFNQDTQEWHSVEPRDGCAVVNVGDSLRFLSGRKFRSVVHRVAPYPGETIENRFSCAYFMRPRMDVEFEDEKGERWKSIDWHMRNYTGLHFTIPPNAWAGPGGELVDVSNDLIIVHRLPAPATLNTFPTVESIGGLYEHDPSSNLYPWSSAGINAFDARFPLGYQAEFLQPFPRLRVLYIIVKPEDIIEQAVNRQQSTMTNYHRDYTQTVHQFPPKTFNARRRIYYEMPEMTCNGLQWLYQTIKDTSAEARPELPPLVIRVMTWRHAPGVRGRFDPN